MKGRHSARIKGRSARSKGEQLDGGGALRSAYRRSAATGAFTAILSGPLVWNEGILRR